MSIAPAATNQILTEWAKRIAGATVKTVTLLGQENRVSLQAEHWDGNLIEVSCHEPLFVNWSAINHHVDDTEIVRARVTELNDLSLQSLRDRGYAWDLTKSSMEELQLPLVCVELFGDVVITIVSRSVHFQVLAAD